jgi:hypothetical protein
MLVARPEILDKHEVFYDGKHVSFPFTMYEKHGQWDDVRKHVL